MPGSVHDVGQVTVEQKEMVAFAKRFDPQPFHTDPAKAKKSIFGGLIASGWYTASVTMRILVDHYVSGVASLRVTRRGRSALAQTRASGGYAFGPCHHGRNQALSLQT